MDTDRIIIENFIDKHPLEAVRILEKLRNTAIAALLKEIPENSAVKVLTWLNSYIAAKTLELLEPDQAARLVEQLDVAVIEPLIRQSSDTLKASLLQKIPPELSIRVRQKLKYSANSVGSLMNTKVFSLLSDLTIKEAERIVKSRKKLNSSEIYLVDKNKKVQGYIHLHDLLVANDESPVTLIMNREIPKFLADEPVQVVNNNLVWLQYKAVPVVDRTGKLIGTLQFEDVKSSRRESEQQIIETGNALAELYRIGLTGLLQSTGKIS